MTITLWSVRRPGDMALDTKVISWPDLDTMNYTERDFLVFFGLYQDDDMNQYAVFMCQSDHRWYAVPVTDSRA